MAADPFWGDVMKLEGMKTATGAESAAFAVLPDRPSEPNGGDRRDCPAEINDLLIARLFSESSLASSVSPIFQRVDERRVLRFVSRDSRSLMQNVA